MFATGEEAVNSAEDLCLLLLCLFLGCANKELCECSSGSAFPDRFLRSVQLIMLLGYGIGTPSKSVKRRRFSKALKAGKVRVASNS